MWQEIIVGVAVAAAAAFMLRRYWPRAKAAPTAVACGSCRGCGKGAGTCH